MQKISKWSLTMRVAFMAAWVLMLVLSVICIVAGDRAFGWLAFSISLLMVIGNLGAAIVEHKERSHVSAS